MNQYSAIKIIVDTKKLHQIKNEHEKKLYVALQDMKN